MKPTRKSRPTLGLFGPIQASSTPYASTLSLFVSRPKRITDALSVLAETPGLTLEVYAREKQRILNQT